MKRFVPVATAISMAIVIVFGLTVALFPVGLTSTVAAPAARLTNESGRPSVLKTDHAGVDQDSVGLKSGTGEDPATASEEQYSNQAFPNTFIDPSQQQGSYTSFLSISKLPGGKKTNWQVIGPTNPVVSAPATYTGYSSVTSGRVTAMALSPDCHATDCKIFIGAAGGGVWEADNALVANPNWHASSNGIPSNAIGSIAFDPTDPKASTLYVGTGEMNGSSDSEAGVGLYKSTDFGKSWSLVPGSVAVSVERSVAAVVVDPSNAKHIFIGTAVARHGLSSVAGGRFTPPNAPVVGLYESTDGGASFHLAFSVPSDTVVPGTPSGNDFFRGGVTNIQYAGSTIYFAIDDYGLYRSTGSGYEQVFASAGGGSAGATSSSRTEFSLAPLSNGNLRIYLADSGLGAADFYRVDNANVPAATLTDGTNNPGWLKLSNSTPGTPGFGSYNFCTGQCWYDMVVYSPPGAPDMVYLAGSMLYGELFGASNGRAVIRSTDAGVHFTDLTNEADNKLGIHPDHHALVSPPTNPNVVIDGSDGGVVRTSGSFADASAQCSARGLSGANLADCQSWLSAVPTQIINLNKGLNTLQFQSVSINAQNPLNDIIGGTQDNGSWGYNGKGNGSWQEFIGGDGGQSGIDVGNANIRMHTYYAPQIDVNFQGNKPLGWDWTSDPLFASGEAASFYIPLINDPSVSGSWFAGLQHVFRTQDNGGPQAYLDQHCNEYTGDFTVTCGDWQPLGNDLTGSAYGSDKGGGYVVAIARASGDASTMWVGTRIGRLFLSTNANAANPASVTFKRVDTSAQPTRFISSIVVDPKNANHIFVSYSGYNAYNPTAPGHVFEVTYDPNSGTASWKDLSYNIGDQPVTSVVRDDVTGDLFASTDFGVAMLANGSTTWTPAAGSLPAVTVYGLSINSQSRVLYAATHGRGIYMLDLSK